jgi:hypothetical protein
MMKNRFTNSSAAAVLALISLANGFPATPQAATAPTVTLTATSASGWVVPAQTQMTAVVLGAHVISVDFYVDGVLTGTDPISPYVVQTTLSSAKEYSLKAVARLTSGALLTSPIVRVTTVSSTTTTPPPPTVPVWTLTANPAKIPSGQSSVLSFTSSTTDIHNVYISGQRPTYTCNTVSCSGSLVVSPKTTTTYTLSATNVKGVTYPTISTTVSVEATTVVQPPVTAPVVSGLPRLQQNNIVYEGSFALPVGAINGSRFGYGATALAFDRITGTLFMVGHDLDQLATEISIPQLRDPRTTTLAMATPVQRFYDSSDGKWTVAGTERDMVKVGGLLPWGNKLITSFYSYYDSNGTQSASHVVGSRDLSVANDAVGPVKVGNLKVGYTSGYMVPVPEAWRAALGGPALVGNCCIPIVSRTSFGPALFSFNPDDVSTTNPVPAQPLVYYPQENPLAPWEATSLLYNGTTKMGGLAFPEGTSSVLFFGRQGTGTFCYGSTCFPGAGQSPNAPPYISQVWAYDPAEFVAVRSGTKQPWEVKPYATWEFLFPTNPAEKIVKGVAYDPATQRIFLSQENGEYPLIHVYKVVLP